MVKSPNTAVSDRLLYKLLLGDSEAKSQGGNIQAILMQFTIIALDFLFVNTFFENFGFFHEKK